jgi:thioredoxin 1
MRVFQRIVLPLLVVTFSYSGSNAEDKGQNKTGPDSGILFVESSWAAIMKKAKAEKKIIFLDAYASWCGPCKLLQKNVFTRSDVGEVFNKNFINVKVDMEKGEGPQLMRLFPLEVYPTLFFIDPNGKIIKKIPGYQSAESLIQIGTNLSEIQL